MSIYRNQADILADILQKQMFRSQPYAQWGNEQNSWNTYNTLEALVDYTRITRSNRYLDTIRQAATDKVLLAHAMDDGVDDEAWAGIALVKAYRLIKDRHCLDAARTIFTNMTTYWDDTCNGGVWWNFKRTYKNAITNELFLVLAMLLYQETKEASYLDWAKKEWNWFAQSGMINSDNLVNDGLSECKNNRGTTWTYNQGVILGGLTELYRSTHDKAYLEQAAKIARAAMERLVETQSGVPILVEPTETPNSDQQQFKGIFVRYLAMLALSQPDKGMPGRKMINDFVLANADALWKNARNDANLVSVHWHQTNHKPIYSATTQSAGLDLLNAAVLLGG